MRFWGGERLTLFDKSSVKKNVIDERLDEANKPVEDFHKRKEVNEAVKGWAKKRE